MKVEEKREKRSRRHRRIKAKIFGTAKVPRLSVFKSKNHIYLQLVDDQKGKTVVSASDKEIKKKAKSQNKKNIKKEEKTLATKKVAAAYEVGKIIAQKAKNLPAEKKIERVIFDRGGYPYHGRVKAAAEGAREGGLKF